MHGTPAAGNQSTGMGDYSFSFSSPQQSYFNPELSDATTLKIAALQAKLNQKLGPEYISQRPGPGGGPKLTYAEGWKIINLANEVFGFNGWSSNVISLTIDFMDYNEESRRYNVGTTAIVRVTLRDGVYHEDIGYGMLENSKSKGSALDKCKKEAVTDGLKRALRNFGNLLGNCLYDKSYTQEVVKMKVAPPKFDKSELHRRPEFDETKPNIASTSSSNGSMSTSTLNPANNTTPTRSTHTAPPHTRVLSSLPLHIRSEVNAATGSSHPNRPEANHPVAQASSSRPQPPLGASSKTSASSATSAPLQEPDTRNNSNPMPPPAAPRNNNIKPPPPAPQPQPKPPPELPQKVQIEDADESFNFNSDDDAFLALVDLGEGDLGQPLLPETDLGRPIDGDEDYSELNQSSESLAVGDGAHTTPAQVKHNTTATATATTSTTTSNPGSSTRAHGHALPYRVPQQASSSSSAGMLSKLLPQNQQQQQARASSSNQFSVPAHKPPSVAHSTNQFRRNSNQPQASRHQNQNQKPASPTGAVGSGNEPAPAKRAPTPSMGGFHFPPGVVSFSFCLMTSVA
ncbi:hypothetical protein H0H81_004861 [Sphagnurus paluster]|uniref:Uncharacterized protein n=1 Tax=Sphagnurus paluster TaxID=117069 RepID=A0A9P7K5Y9_9AGAR|nr:hypothetical protein H0H81_004861 [Sphagnurus paluster]